MIKEKNICGNAQDVKLPKPIYQIGDRVYYVREESGDVVVYSSMVTSVIVRTEYPDRIFNPQYEIMGSSHMFMEPDSRTGTVLVLFPTAEAALQNFFSKKDAEIQKLKKSIETFLDERK